MLATDCTRTQTGQRVSDCLKEEGYACPEKERVLRDSDK